MTPGAEAATVSTVLKERGPTRASALLGLRLRRDSTGLKPSAILVGFAAFATTFAQSRILGQLPTTFLLKEHFHLPKESVALFFFWVMFPWNIKPLVGILTDAFPIFGTRRRHYMLLGSVSAVGMWLLMGATAGAYLPLLYATVGMNVAMVLASTVAGGLMVETGQTYGASGRMSSLRLIAQNVAAIAAPLAGGYLAARAYGWTAAIGAATAFGLALCTFFVLDESTGARLPTTRLISMASAIQRPPWTVVLGLATMTALATALLGVADLREVAYSLYGLIAAFTMVVVLATIPTRNQIVAGAQHQLNQVFRSSTLWLAVLLLFLVYTVPGFNTPLVYQQSDVLQFSKSFIGILTSLEGVAGVAAAAVYAIFCRRMNLRLLLVASVGFNGAVTFLYLIYTASTAPAIHSLGGFAFILSELALMDLAIRSTPRGCEALGFALMMSVRNFGLAISDVLGSQLMDQYQVSFNTLIVINSVCTLAVLAFVPLLPSLIMNRVEGEVLP